MKFDPKYFGVPNICFSLVKPYDKREIEFSEQRIIRGFDDSETWSLRSTIGNFIIPRLKRYEEIVKETLNLENEEREFGEAIPKMIRAFELVVREEGAFILTEDEQKEYDDGIFLFSKFFLALWW
jgi:hypothetical protein